MVIDWDALMASIPDTEDQRDICRQCHEFCDDIDCDCTDWCVGTGIDHTGSYRPPTEVSTS